MNNFTISNFEFKGINIQDITVNFSDNIATAIVNLPFACQTIEEDIESEIISHLRQNYPITLPIKVQIKSKIIPHKVKPGLVRISNIKNIIAVSSGKGGVGKSTIALNLAIALMKNGAKVGLLDADIYGPSIPLLLGSRDFKPEVHDALFIPLEKYGIKAMSFGFLINEKQPAIWRGAIINKALEQLMFETNWGELDYLIVDLPPGTGDIHLTMCQKMPITGIVTITTPQDVALIDVTKSIEMYQKLNLPILGIVENMSTHICSNCGHVDNIFGDQAGTKLSQEYDVKLLAQLPLSKDIRLKCDEGYPIALQDDEVAKLFSEAAIKIAYELSKLPKDYSSNLGKIQVTTS